MIEACLVQPGTEMIIPGQKSKKEDMQNNLCEELLRERAAVLTRAGLAVEDVLNELHKLDTEIASQNRYLDFLIGFAPLSEKKDERRMLVEKINLNIELFNRLNEKCQLRYYYLIVTREAMGLRRHNMLQEVYKIPAKKKKMKTC